MTESTGNNFATGTTLHYRQIDVRDVPKLNEVIKNISDSQGKLDGLIAAAGIQQETSALEYTQADANLMFEVNITGEHELAGDAQQGRELISPL
jgi:NADP-dependent 3-hydroxy acid dehydrogenase YdfG